MRVVNIITTYNEKEMVGRMIEYLDKLAGDLPKYEFITLVVDSSSPDGTGEIVKKMAKTRKNLYLLETPRGLGVSLIQAYQYAMRDLKADIVIPNDVDFQWHPKYIPEMLAKIEEGYDVVVPSRHVPGGRDNFNWFRKLTHFVSNTLINYYWGGIHEVKDLAGNFKAIRVKGILDKVNLKRLNVKGFVIQSIMIYELSKTGAKFCEIPAIYGDRLAGQGKVGFNLQFIKDILETILEATKIRIERSQRFIKFGIVGGTGFVVNYVGLELLKRAGLSTYFATLFATEAAIISNFIFNNIWTFKDKVITKVSDVIPQFIKFNVSSLFAVIVQPLIVAGAAKLFGDTSLVRLFALVFALIVVIIPYNYVVYNLFIWKTWKLPWAKK